MESNPILITIERYKFHPRILKINEKIYKTGDFIFSKINSNNIYNEIFELKNNVSSPNDCIPLHIIKNNLDLFVSKLCFDINFSTNHCTFPHNLKCADITPVHKTDEHRIKSNYHPVNILPTISKIFERLLFYQINDYIEIYLLNYQCGFRKDIVHNTIL